MRIEEKIVPKSESDNSFYQGTKRWKNAQNVIKYTEKNGGKETTVEIPAGGVREKIAEREKQIQINKLQSINCIPDSNTITSSSSEISIASHHSSEENHNAKQVKSKSLSSLGRSNTNTPLFSNNSRRESPKIFKLNREGRLVILSENHPFLEKIEPERKKIPQSYRDAIRIDNLTDNEMDDLIDYDKTIAVGKPSLKA